MPRLLHVMSSRLINTHACPLENWLLIYCLMLMNKLQTGHHRLIWSMTPYDLSCVLQLYLVIFANYKSNDNAIIITSIKMSSSLIMIG